MNDNKESTPLLQNQQQMQQQLQQQLQSEQEQLQFTPQQLKLLQKIQQLQQLQQLQQQLQQQMPGINIPNSYQTINSSQPIIIREKMSEGCMGCIIFSVVVFMVLVGVGIYIGITHNN